MLTKPRQPRLFILTDIGGDPDDTQSMVRLIAYSNHFTIVGLIATSRMSHGVDTQPHLIRRIVEDFALVQGNLQTHAAHAQLPPYSSADSLLQAIGSGQPGILRTPGDAASWSVPFGAGHSTEASRRIIAAVDAASAEEPLHLAIWGGAADLAQALFDVRASRSPADVAAFVARLRVCVTDDQDGSGAWINREFPDLFYLVSLNASRDDGTPIACSASVRGMYQNDACRDDGSAQQLVPDEQLHLVTQATVQQYIADPAGRRPLRRCYPSSSRDNWQHKEIWRGPTQGFPHNGHGGTKEGDTPTWFYFLLNGLNLPETPGAGGWGGRYQRVSGGLHTPAGDRHWSPQGDQPPQRALEACWAVARWRETAFNDFATRLQWADSPLISSAAHPPIIQEVTAEPAATVRPGQTVRLSAVASDPDGRRLSFRWWQYPEAGTLPADVAIVGDRSPQASFRVPAVERPCTLHVVLSVSNDALLPLTSYHRLIFSIDP